MRETVHPLTLFFQSRKFTAADGMAWLQSEGREKYGALISDNCVMPEDVADCDVDAVLRLANARHFIPASRRTAEDLEAMKCA